MSIQLRPEAQSAPHPTYDFGRLASVEDRHFWFIARNRVIATLVKQITGELQPGYRVLELGCGTGNVLRVLEQSCYGGRVFGMDLFLDGLRYARQRTSCPLVQGDIERAPLRSSFDLIGIFDVLEHLPDDIKILRHLHSMLVPGGRLLLTVPAHASLWSYFDEASHHCRRYKLKELRSKLLEAGYEVEFLSYFMAPIFPLVWLGRRLAALFGRRSNSVHELAVRELRILPIINQLLTFLLTQETHFVSCRRSLPLGTSLAAVARKAD